MTDGLDSNDESEAGSATKEVMMASEETGVVARSLSHEEQEALKLIRMLKEIKEAREETSDKDRPIIILDENKQAPTVLSYPEEYR